MMRGLAGPPDPGGFDPLELRLDAVAATGRLATDSSLHRRLRLGLSPGSMPGLLLLLLGVALGPQGVNLLSAAVLSFLDPAVSVALAALGVLVGLDLGVGTTAESRRLVAATFDGALTIVVVTVGIMFIAAAWNESGGQQQWILPVLLGICASSSAAIRSGDLNDLLPIVLGGLVLVVIRETSPGLSFLLAAQAIGVVLLIAMAAALLMTPAASDTEQRVFAVATLLLIGGAAEYLSLSALLCGLVAGGFWRFAAGSTRECIRRDVGYIQHPLLVLVLLVAGARVDFSPSLAAFVVAYVLLRSIGRLAGAWVARRIDGDDARLHLNAGFFSAGIVGVAFALDANRAAGPDAGSVLTVVVAGALASEVIGRLVQPREGVR